MSQQRENATFMQELLDWVSISNLRCFGFLAAISLCLFLPGFFTLQPMDRDEPRFAQASKQMLETGDFVSIRFQDEARNKKPVGIYWLQSGVVAAGEAIGIANARDQIWLYRIPSLLGAIIAVLGTFWAALALTDRRRALLAAALMASTILLGVEARLAKTDAVLLVTVVLSMGALARLYLRRTLLLSHAAIFWGAMALGILIKGPIAPMIPLFAILVLGFRERSFRWLLPLRPLLGLALVLLVVSPWFILIAIKTHGAFFTDSLGQDMLNKVSSGQESHGAPPLTYFALFWVTAWPLAPALLLSVPAIWATRKSPQAMFLLAWAVPAWILFELVPTKLPHYVLPIYPALAILAGRYFPAASAPQLLRGIAAAVAVIVPVGFVSAAILLWVNRFHTLIPGWAVEEPTLLLSNIWVPAVPVVIAALAFAFFAARSLLAQRLDKLAFFGGLAAASLGLTIYTFVLTAAAFEPAALSPRLAAAQDLAEKNSTCTSLAPVSTGFQEPSLVFLTQTSLKFLDATEAAAFVSETQCSIAFVDARDEPAFAAALDAKIAATLVQRLRGINLGNGKRLDIGVYVRQ